MMMALENICKILLSIRLRFNPMFFITIGQDKRLKTNSRHMTQHKTIDFWLDLWLMTYDMTCFKDITWHCMTPLDKTKMMKDKFELYIIDTWPDWH